MTFMEMSKELVRIAQNDYMIDQYFLDDGKLLLKMAGELLCLEMESDNEKAN